MGKKKAIKQAAAIDKALRDQMTAPPAPKKPVACAPLAPTQAATAEKPKEPDTLECTPKDGKLSYTRKEGEPGFKPD